MAQRIIGLDIGSWSIKAMVMESSLRRMSFVELRQHHLPVDAHGMPLPGELGAAIKAVLARLDVDVLTVGVPGVQVLLRELSLPFSDEKRVGPILGFQLESLLPRPLDTMVYDWHVLKKTPEGAQLLCPAADKQWLEHWLTEVRTGGSEPRHLTLSALAMGNLSPHLDLSAAGDKPIAVIDLGHRTTQVTLLRGGEVEAIRALSRGGHQVTQALAKVFGLAYADAEHIKHAELDLSGATPDGVDAQEHTRRVKVSLQALEPILRELKMTIDAMSSAKLRQGTGAGFGATAAAAAAASQTAGTALVEAAGNNSGLGGVILCGGMSRLPGMAALIERLLDAPVLEARPKGPIWEAVAQDPALLDVGLAASALALEHMRDSDPHRVNLRRGDMSLVSDYGALRARAGWLFAFLAVLLVIFFVRKAMRVSTLEEQEAQLAVRLDEYGEKTLGEKPDPDLEVKARFETVLDLVTSPPGSETDDVYPSITAFKTFYEITRIQRALNDEAERAAAAAGGGGNDLAEEPEEDEFGMPKPPSPATPPTAATPAQPVADKKQVELNSFASDLKSANVGTATLAGSAFDIVTVENFVAKLKEFGCFKKVERQETKKTSNVNHPNWTDFTIKIEVKCDLAPGAAPRADAGADKAKAADKGAAASEGGE